MAETEGRPEYIRSFLAYPNPVLKDLEAEYDRRMDIQPSVGPEVGAFLTWTAWAISARRVLDIGTCLGYSAIFLGEAMRHTSGKVISVEAKKSLYLEAARNIERAGLSDTVSLIHGDAREVIRALDGPFDLILQDAEKTLYPVMLEDCVQRLRPNGILAADDVLFLPDGVPGAWAEAVHEFNRRIFADPRLVSTILPIGDGLLISVKK